MKTPMNDEINQKVSVYMPTKNRRELLSLAINSVLNQTHKNIELIVVNDGSTDDTEDYLTQLALSDERVKVINNKKSVGAPASRNKAIIEATGNFITGLDDDDYFHKSRIEILIKHWVNFKNLEMPVSCLYTQDVRFNSKNEKNESKKISRAYTNDFYTMNPVGNQVFAPKNYYIEAGLFDEELPAWQDLDMFYRIIEKFGCARLIDMPLYYFFDDDRTDRISKNSEKVKRAAEIMIRKHAQGNKKVTNLFLSQVYAHHYGYKPTLKDISKFAISDLSDLKLVIKMLKKSIF